MTHSTAIDQEATTDALWETAMEWVEANRKLIRQIASPYRRHMAAEYADIFQEATIAAFKALLTARKKAQPERFGPFFRVIFKTNCIRLASGIPTEDCLEVHNLPIPDDRNAEREDDDNQVQVMVEKALKIVSKRQREICIWLLQQPEPVSTPDLARQFNITRRHACRLISNSIKRIEAYT